MDRCYFGNLLLVACFHHFLGMESQTKKQTYSRPTISKGKLLSSAICRIYLIIQGNEDDIRENVIQYAEEAGEQDAADPTIGYRAVQKNSRYEEAANEVAKLKRCTSEDNFNGAPWDSRLLYKYEGSNSVLNSLSSINTNMTDRSIDLRVSPTQNNFLGLNQCSGVKCRRDQN